MGLFYRFHLDAAVNLPESKDGIKHALLIVESFSKWIELVPLKELNAKNVRRHFEREFWQDLVDRLKLQRTPVRNTRQNFMIFVCLTGSTIV